MKRSKAFLALMLSATMTVTGISPVWGADVFSDGETEITDHTPETSEQELAEDELSMFSQETSQDNGNDNYEFSMENRQMNCRKMYSLQIPKMMF